LVEWIFGNNEVSALGFVVDRDERLRPLKEEGRVAQSILALWRLEGDLIRERREGQKEGEEEEKMTEKKNGKRRRALSRVMAPFSEKKIWK